MEEGADPTGIWHTKLREERAGSEEMVEQVILGYVILGAAGEEVTGDPAEWEALRAARTAKPALRKRGVTVEIVPMDSVIME